MAPVLVLFGPGAIVFPSNSAGKLFFTESKMYSMDGQSYFASGRIRKLIPAIRKFEDNKIKKFKSFLFAVACRKTTDLAMLL